MKRSLTAVAIVFASIVAVGGQTTASVSREFKSDGCSMWPDGNYRQCCVKHDEAYFVGGGRRDRRKADDELYSCVKSQGRRYNKVIAPFMWVGVRIGGVGWLPTPFRWGFGNEFPKTRPSQTDKDKAGKK